MRFYVYGLIIAKFALLAFALVAVTLSFLGCATKGLPSLNEQLDFNQQIQDCIVQGGHPHLGPGRTVICN